MKKAFVALFLSLCLALCAASADARDTDDVGAMLPREQTLHGKVSGNVKTKKFHYQNCRYYDCRDCTKIFKSAAAARKAGYVPCKKCYDYEQK